MAKQQYLCQLYCLQEMYFSSNYLVSVMEHFAAQLYDVCVTNRRIYKSREREREEREKKAHERERQRQRAIKKERQTDGCRTKYKCSNKSWFLIYVRSILRFVNVSE